MRAARLEPDEDAERRRPDGQERRAAIAGAHRPIPGARRTPKRISVTPSASVDAAGDVERDRAATRATRSCRVATRKNAMTPSGMLIEKMRPPAEVHRQEGAERAGPTSAANPQTPEKSPWMRARSSSE